MLRVFSKCAARSQDSSAKTNFRGGLYFMIFFHNTFHGSRDFFYKFTFQDIVHYMSFELNINDVFVSLSSVMSQNTGISIGGSTSAQAASLVLIYRELRGDLPEMLKDLLWLRYRDNFLILHRPDSAGFSVDKWTAQVQESFAKMTEVRKSHCHVFLGGLDPGQAPLKPFC